MRVRAKTKLEDMQTLTSMRHPSLIAVCAIATWLALLCAGCSKTETPEQRVRALIDNAEQAVEQKDIRTLRGYVSARYSDAHGRDRRTVDGILRLYLLRHEKIHLLTRIESVQVTDQGRAEAVVYIAMVGRPIMSAAELAALRADFYRFEIAFAEEDEEWRVIRAAWRPAELADFVYQN